MTAKPYKWWLGRLVAGKVSFSGWGGEGRASPEMARPQNSMVPLVIMGKYKYLREPFFLQDRNR